MAYKLLKYDRPRFEEIIVHPLRNLKKNRMQESTYIISRQGGVVADGYAFAAFNGKPRNSKLKLGENSRAGIPAPHHIRRNI